MYLLTRRPITFIMFDAHSYRAFTLRLNLIWKSRAYIASLTIFIAQGSIDVVLFHNQIVLILRAALLVFFAVWGALANAADKSTKDTARVHYAWQQVVAELEDQHGKLTGDMEDTRNQTQPTIGFRHPTNANLLPRETAATVRDPN
jgi:hypothetical protein